MEIGQQVGQVEGRACDHHSDRDVAAHQAGQLVDRESRSGNRAECRSRVEKDGGTGLSYSHRPAGAVQQVLTELTFQLANLGAHARLGYMQPGGGPGEACFVCHGNEVFELSEFHNQRC